MGPLLNRKVLFSASCIAADVRFGSKADICSAQAHVRFTPDSDQESGHRQPVMSALPPKADMCGATRDVRFGPIADSCTAAKTCVIRSPGRRAAGTTLGS